MLRLVVISTILMCTALAAADPPTKVRPVEQWSGEKGDPDLKKAAPIAITTQKEFEKLWEAWRGKESMPTVDFKTQFVAVVVLAPENGVKILDGTKGVTVIGLEVDGKGDATIMYGPSVGTNAPGEQPPEWKVTKGFYYGLAVFPRAGVKTVLGKELP